MLNWRIWAALAFMAAETLAGYKLHQAGFEAGSTTVQGEFDRYKLKDIESAMAAQVARQAKETAMQATNQKVTENYVSLQTATATAVHALDADRMRLQAVIATGSHTPGQDPGAGLPPDGAAQVGILAACIDRYAAVAGDADRISDQLTALQAYVAGVVPKP